ncbi:hypothetical protein A9239_10325 [Methanosarcina sp. A14]|uniref:Sensory transduction histidine kinase n=3 Tax=Methanosarcina barkeri TaxID=2208 RepID=A0A0E3LNU1_METBA|nr:sensory transduction histidine kinase [Methanosarcina barkeri MS]AKB58844.1 sensory transduction histidine kinase [Methanosarcina barkeri 227]AKJ38504.1 hypothetical protein MCM1_1458 [Methanosarcina barkeri CM1]OED07241.1 hypothetical protein A9239_10325 [Methanosarcina sp. A14]
MSLMQYLHMIFAYSVPDQLNIWHVLLTRYLHLIFTYHIYYQFSNWNKLLPRYLQTFVSVLVLADVTIKLSKDIYKTKVLQKKRKGLLELNWTIPRWVHKKSHLGFDKCGALLDCFYINQNIFKQKQVGDVLSKSKQCMMLLLWSILLSTKKAENLEVNNIIETQAIQSLMSDFYKRSSIPIALVDLKGNVLAGVGWHDTLIRFYSVYPKDCKLCMENDKKLFVNVSLGEFKIYRSQTNIWSIAAPFMIGGAYVANVFTGQFFFEDETIDYEFFRSQARKYGLDEEESIEMLEKVPRLSKKDVDKNVKFLLAFTKLITNNYFSCPISWFVSHLKTNLFNTIVSKLTGIRKIGL